MDSIIEIQVVISTDKAALAALLIALGFQQHDKLTEFVFTKQLHAIFQQHCLWQQMCFDKWTSSLPVFDCPPADLLTTVWLVERNGQW